MKRRLWPIVIAFISTQIISLCDQHGSPWLKRADAATQSLAATVSAANKLAQQQQQQFLAAAGAQLSPLLDAYNHQQQQHQTHMNAHNHYTRDQSLDQLSVDSLQPQVDSPATPNNQDTENQADQLMSSGSQQEEQDNQQQTTSGARERCRELISLTLLSFKDLSPNERASEEIDCANLREQIAAATGRSFQQSPGGSRRPPIRQLQQQPRQTDRLSGPGVSDPDSEGQEQTAAAAPTQLPTDDFPLAPPNYSLTHQSANFRQQLERQQQQKSTTSQRPATRQQKQQQPVISESSKWEPKNSYLNQMQQLLLQQQQQQRSRQQHEQQSMLQFYQQQFAAAQQKAKMQQQQQQQMTMMMITSTTTTTTPQPTTLATTFETLLETTTLPPTTTTTTTSTTTTARPVTPKIRIGAPPGGRRRANGRGARTSTSTTTTTTQKPSAAADYADGSEASTDYYDEYDDQQQQLPTTTTTTTAKPVPRRQNNRKGRRRFSTTSTTPKPTTSSTTLSPGYQPRPDGRIIDYMADPNFPRELKGADLTNYPFYISVPDKIDFECKGRHDGYYTNIDLHCQIYHHCAIGQRYDFLCPNYTLFDQTTFTCRFINTVDCDGSAKHFDRNNALYVEKDEVNSNNKSADHATASSSPSSSSLSSGSGKTSTTTTSTTTTTTTSTTQAPKLSHRNGQPTGGRHGERTPISAFELAMQHQQARIAGGSQTALIASRAGTNGSTGGATAGTDTTIK